MTRQIEEVFPNLPNARWVALRLLDGDERIAEAIKNGGLGDLSREEREQAEHESPLDLALEGQR